MKCEECVFLSLLQSSLTEQRHSHVRIQQCANPVFCVSQSVVARGLLNSIQERSGYVPVYINFSAQTSSARTQEIIESKLEKKRKKVLGNDSHHIKFSL